MSLRSGFRIYFFEFGVTGLGCRVSASGFRVGFTVGLGVLALIMPSPTTPRLDFKYLLTFKKSTEQTGVAGF